MIACVHQPNYLPYPGYFNKIKNSEIFVIYDAAQYVKDRWDNRNRIRTKDGFMYLTIPLEDKDSFLKRFYEVKLPENSKWQQKHWKAIDANYSKAEHFNSYKDFFRKVYFSKWEKMVDINENIIKYLIKEFSLNAKIIKSTELNLDLSKKSTELLINILNRVGAKTYLSGPTGRKYMDLNLFKKSCIKLEFQKYKLCEYKQRFSGFVPGLSSIDLLFNMGEKSKKLI